MQQTHLYATTNHEREKEGLHGHVGRACTQHAKVVSVESRSLSMPQLHCEVLGEGRNMQARPATQLRTCMLDFRDTSSMVAKSSSGREYFKASGRS